jgi:predicted MFS family arabinose efflux permease
MTELLPSARATLMAFNVAAMSFGRALGALIAPRLYGISFLAVVLRAFVFNLVALLSVNRLRYVQA